MTTSVDSFTGGLKIEWVSPDPQGEPITAYVIEVATSTAMSSWSSVPDCPGIDPTQTSCIVPMLGL